jgi:hypothetical protein
MPFTDEQLSRIFERTDGRCHICGRKLCFSNYGQFWRRGDWEVEHSKPRCNGGSDRLCNLYAAHISCNREKGAMATRTVRAWNGRTKAPLSKQRKEEVRNDNRLGWGSVGALTGGVIFGPPGFVLGGILGAMVGDGIEPE